MILWRGIVLGWKWRWYLWRCSVVRICNLDEANSSSKTFFFCFYLPPSSFIIKLLYSFRYPVVVMIFFAGHKKELSFSDLSLCFDHVSTQTSFFSCLLTNFLNAQGSWFFLSWIIVRKWPDFLPSVYLHITSFKGVKNVSVLSLYDLSLISLCLGWN